MINYNRFALKSIDYLYNYIIDNHLNSLVLGISGGIDSTVVACLASIACKTAKIPLIGRSLPAHSNNPDEINSATLVGQAFCDDFKEVAIERMYAKVADEMELNEGKMTPLQLGNVKARLRMIYLYNLASIHRGCVLDTDNKSEHELGFWTIHGDVGDLNCGLIYLWKTEVYELANYLANEAMGLTQEQKTALKESIKLIPTDGNGVMLGGDCAQFGLDNYEQVDDVLKTMYFPEDGMNNIKYKEEYIRLIDSYNEQGVDKVMMLHQNSMFKRLPQPIFPSKEILGL
jgi:NAD+ synthetase